MIANRPWHKRYHDHYLRGTRSLSLEQRGAYNDVLELTYSLGRPLPDDDSWMAHALVISVRKWRSVKAALLAAGKLSIKDGQIHNERAERELSKAVQQADENPLPPVSQPVANIGNGAAESRDNDEKSKNDNDINEPVPIIEAEKSSLDSDTDKDRKKEGGGGSARAPGLCSDDLKSRLAEAAGDGVDWGSPAIEILGPMREMARYRDLDLDILPAIRAECNRRRLRGAEKIRGWEYFRGGIDRAWKARTRPQTAAGAIADAVAPALNYGQLRRKRWEDALAKLEAEAAGRAVQ